jgi:hypothetical protein
MYTATSGRRIADSVIEAIVSGQQQSAMKNAYRDKLLEQQRKENEIRQQMASTQQGVNKTQMGLAVAKDIVNALAKAGVIKSSMDKTETQEVVPAETVTPKETPTLGIQQETPSAEVTETDIGDKAPSGGVEIGGTDTTSSGGAMTNESVSEASQLETTQDFMGSIQNMEEAETLLEATMARVKDHPESKNAYKAYKRARAEYERLNKVVDAKQKMFAEANIGLGRTPMAYDPVGNLVPAFTMVDASGNTVYNPNSGVFNQIKLRTDPTLAKEAGIVEQGNKTALSQEQGGTFNPAGTVTSGIGLASGISDIVNRGANLQNVLGTVGSGIGLARQGASLLAEYGGDIGSQIGGVGGALQSVGNVVAPVGSIIGALGSGNVADGARSLAKGALPYAGKIFSTVGSTMSGTGLGTALGTAGTALSSVISTAAPYYALAKAGGMAINMITANNPKLRDTPLGLLGEGLKNPITGVERSIGAKLAEKGIGDRHTNNTVAALFNPGGILEELGLGTWICTAVKKHTYLTNDEEDVIAKLRVYAKEKHNKWFRLYLVHGMKLVNAIAKQEKDLKEFYTNIREILVKPVTELFDKDNEAAYQLYHKTTELLRSKYLPELIVDGGELCPYKA